jgi:hypothetical protein
MVNPRQSREPRSSAPIPCLLVVVVVFICGYCLAQAPSSSNTPDPNRQRVRLKLPPDVASTPTTMKDLHARSKEFEIPDATPIHFRLAQPVRGITWSLVNHKVYSREGDTVRLVAADDVRVNGMVVIPKGAIGQATVTKVAVPDLAPAGSYKTGDAIELFIPKTGDVSLQLDWVEDVTG